MGKNGTRSRQAAARRILAHVEARMPADRLRELAAGGPIATDAADAADAAEWNRRLLRRVFGLGLGFVARQRHLDATVAALHGGDPDALATMDDAAAAAFLEDAAVIRNRHKLYAARHNAAVVVALRDTWGGPSAWAAALVADGPPALLRDLRSRFRLVGPVSAARLAQDLGVDVLVPHPAVVRTLHRLGWLDDPKDDGALHALADAVAPRPPGGVGARLGRLSVALLAFATGRWIREAVCGGSPACGECPAQHDCARVGVE